jgi:hypothetical protein
VTPEQEADLWRRLQLLEQAHRDERAARAVEEKAEAKRAQWFRYGLTTIIAMLGAIAIPLIIVWITLHQGGVKP